MPRTSLRLSALLLTIAAVAATPARADAQIRASELSSVSQTVDGTTIRLTYSRPRMRGRWPIFGTSAVQWGEVWTPGANWATLLETSKDITVGDKRVPKGKYGVWFVVRKDSAWTMLLDPEWKQFHMDHPEPDSTQIHIPLRVDSAAVEEVLTFSFPAVNAGGGTIAMRWARTQVSVDFTVAPTLSDLLPERDAAPYVGTYVMRDPKADADSGRVIVTYEGGGLKARFEPGDPYLKTFALMRVGPDVFTVGLYEKGVIYEVLKPDMMFTFTRLPGRPVTFEVRGEGDELYFTGRRTVAAARDPERDVR